MKNQHQFWWSAEDSGNRIYKFFHPLALATKVITQMIVGVLIFLMLACKAIALLGYGFCAGSNVHEIPTLKIVGYGLEYSAGVELAYMLFTPGPDEAMDPLLLGLSAAVLIIVSDDQWSIKEDGLIAPILCITICILFVVRQYIVKPASDREMMQMQRDD